MTDTTRSPLFQPIRLGALDLPNRILMAPMTRSMADDDLVPTEAMAEYYARRADAGLIVTEATIIRPDGQGYPNTPGLFTDSQVEGWRRVTDRVHQRGGRIFNQIWHVGRVSHPDLLGGKAPIAPSAVPLSGRVPRTQLRYGTPRALDVEEIAGLVESFAAAARRALDAGFDGVEIHGANGYLIDQFLHGHTNRRTDAYGSRPEGMTRFPLEVVDAVIAVVGPGRAGLRLSPGAYFNMESDAGDREVFLHLLRELDRRDLAYVHVGIFDDAMTFEDLGGSATAFLREHYRGTLVGNGSYTPGRGAEALAESRFDLIAIGRPFIANPDLVSRIAGGEDLRPYDEGMLSTLE